MRAGSPTCPTPTSTTRPAMEWIFMRSPLSCWAFRLRRGDQLYRHHPPAPRARHGDQQNAALALQHAYDLLRHPLRHACAHAWPAYSWNWTGAGALHFFDVAAAATSAAVAAVVLVLWPSLGVRHLPACHGHDFDDDSRVFPAPYRWLSLCRDVHDTDRSGRLRRLAAPHVRRGNVGNGDELLQRRQHD